MDPAVVFRALGDPARLTIVSMVAEAGELCVCKIVERMPMGQPAVSHHLAKLRNAGILRGRRCGQWVHYSLDPSVAECRALRLLQDLSGKAEAFRVQADGCCGAVEAVR